MDTPGMFQTRSQVFKAFFWLTVCIAIDLALAAALLWAIYTLVGGLTR